jgi:hypothetical protein
LRPSTLKLNLDEDSAAGMRILQILNEIILLFSKNMVCGWPDPWYPSTPWVRPSTALSPQARARHSIFLHLALLKATICQAQEKQQVYYGCHFKVLNESHVICTTICNRRHVKMPNWKLTNLCGTAGDNAHTISTCSICCQTLYLIVAECVPLAIEDNSRDIGSMPF